MINIENDPRLIRFDPVLCQTCGVPYAMDGASGCEEHSEAECDQHQQNVPPVLQRAYIKGALSILTAVMRWEYVLGWTLDDAIRHQIADYLTTLEPTDDAQK